MLLGLYVEKHYLNHIHFSQLVYVSVVKIDEMTPWYDDSSLICYTVTKLHVRMIINQSWMIDSIEIVYFPIWEEFLMCMIEVVNS